MTNQSALLVASLTAVGTWAKLRWLIIAIVVLALAAVVAVGRIRQRLIRHHQKESKA
ncbi:MAG: hypothetical protein LBL55_09945 [Propionibacteriaceae bacterium]|jgi:hypothetical protein|nr:hypothetical protein [Propionibacteriaceae bacterium]